MQQNIDLEAWKRDGQSLWDSIQKEKLIVLWWNNPFPRLSIVGAIILASSIVSWFLWRTYLISTPIGAISLLFFFLGAKYYVVGRKTGGLYSFFSENGFGIGCDADRILIPYGQIAVPDRVSPSTVNENYIVLPAIADPKVIVIESKNGDRHTWDGAPYKRGIASIEIRDGVLIARAYPNQMIVNFFCAIYPLSLYLKSRNAQIG